MENLRYRHELKFLCRGVFPVGEELLEVKYDEVLPAAIAEILAAGQ